MKIASEDRAVQTIRLVWVTGADAVKVEAPCINAPVPVWYSVILLSLQALYNSVYGCFIPIFKALPLELPRHLLKRRYSYTNTNYPLFSRAYLLRAFDLAFCNKRSCSLAECLLYIVCLWNRLVYNNYMCAGSSCRSHWRGLHHAVMGQVCACHTSFSWSSLHQK